LHHSLVAKNDSLPVKRDVLPVEENNSGYFRH